MFHVLNPPTDKTYVTVAHIMICGEHIVVSCYVKSGAIFINGKTAISHKSVRETLEWYIGNSMDNYKIEDLFFQKGSAIRPAHAWEFKTVYTSHWQYYAKNNIRFSASLASSFFIGND
jgi:hypothetical protein